MSCDINLKTMIKHMEDLNMMRNKLLDIDNYKPIDYQLDKGEDFHKILDKDKSMRKLVYNYTDTSYTLMNKTYRNLVDNKNILKQVNDLTNLFKCQGDTLGVTYRGTRLNYEVIKALKPGDILINPTPLSSSTKFSEGMAWANSGRLKPERNMRVLLRIDNKVLPQYNIDKYSANPGEGEVLIEPNLPLIFKGIQNRNNIRELHLEVDRDYINNPTKTKHAVYNALGILLGLGLGSQIDKTK